MSNEKRGCWIVLHAELAPGGVYRTWRAFVHEADAKGFAKAHPTVKAVFPVDVELKDLLDPVFIGAVL